jgi:hypothetical protein
LSNGRLKSGQGPANVNRIEGSDKSRKGLIGRNGQQERVMWRSIAKAVRELQRSLAVNGTSYRPDLHYMRGPGPKWHAKYGSLAPKSEPPGSAVSLRTASQHRA